MPEHALNVGFGALAVVLATAGVGRGLRERDAQQPRRSEQVALLTAARATTLAPLNEDSIVTGIALLEDFFGEPLSRLDCAKAPPCYDLDFLIVSLPDPLDSFLDWAFDADLESMRRALESAQFVTNRFWLPWDEDRKVASNRAATHYRRGHPGVFLFRNSNPNRHRLRLVYVVGEISTGGVHKRALEAALDERRTLLETNVFVDSIGARDTIRFVGPFFTGSALSTRLTLERWRKANRDTTFALFVSGAATGSGNLVVFDTSHDAVNPASRMSFHATVNSDLTLSLAMRRVMVDSLAGLGIPADHIALVEESSTQYGQQAGGGRSSPSDSIEGVQLPAVRADTSRLSTKLRNWSDTVRSVTNEMLLIPYPMSISTLRAEYAKNPAAPKADEFTIDQAPRVPLPLYESNGQLESPTPLARLTPASLELMIDEITQTLKSHDIRAIGLIGTDVRDKIFLADQLRKDLPDARLFTFGSNDLYLRDEYNSALRGMLVFSTYPLFLQNQWWDSVTRARPRRFAFASDDAQGVFNATLRQLRRPGLREYRAPFESRDTHPPVWVTAVGRHSFIPIRALRGLDGANEYLETLEPPKAEIAPDEHHVSQSDWVRWLTYIVLSGVILFLVLSDDADSRARIPVHESESSQLSTSSGNNPLPPESSTAEVAIRRFVDRRRLGLRAALLLHREAYTFLRHLALLSVFATLAVVLVPPAAEYHKLRWASPVVYSVLLLAAIAALITFFARVRDVWLEWGGAYCDYVYRPSRRWMEREIARAKRLIARVEKNHMLKALSMLTPTVEYEIRARAPRAERSVWRREGIVMTMIVLVGVTYATAVAKLIADLEGLDVGAATVFVHRAMQLDSGVSPIFPIVLSSAALAILCTWQLSRLRLLDEVTAFEEAFQLSSTRISQIDADDITSRIAKGLHSARMHLSRVVPGIPSGLGRLFAILLFVLLASALWMHFEPSFEAITGIPRIGRWTAFDVVFRLSILLIFIAAAWGVTRLVMVWRALRVTLNALDASPLITAFERLPRRIARLTRLTLFADPSRETVLAVTATQWLHLRSLFTANAHAFEEVGVAAADEVRTLMAEDAPLHGRDHRRAGCTFAPQLNQMLRVIERFWIAEPATAQVDAVLADLKRLAQTDGASTSGRIRRSAPDAVRLWVRSAEEFVAVQAVDYIAWILRHLRRLVLLLLFLLLVTMGLLSSYSFLPQSVVRSLFLVLFIAVVVSLLLLLSQMNRNEVLSRVMRTDPGRVNWNTGFLLNIGTVVAIPILSLVSAFSPLRTDLFGWVDAILRVITKH
jgi:hypothetical protein